MIVTNFILFSSGRVSLYSRLSTDDHCCAKLAIQVAQKDPVSPLNDEDHSERLSSPNQIEQPLANSPWQECSQLFSTEDTSINECLNPGKTVLRPRSGQEYVLLSRKFTSFQGEANKCRLVKSQGNASSQVQASVYNMFNFDFTTSATQAGLPNTVSSIRQGSACLSSCSGISPLLSPLPSPNLSNQADSFSFCPLPSPSPSPQQIHSQSLIPSLNHHSITTLSSRSSPLHSTSDFPSDLSLSPTSSSPSSLNPTQDPTYVNHKMIRSFLNTSNQTVSSGSCHSAPHRAGMQSLLKLFKDSPRLTVPDSSSSLGRIRKNRSRVSESDAYQKEKHSLSVHSSTLPCATYRSLGRGGIERSNPLVDDGVNTKRSLSSSHDEENAKGLLSKTHQFHTEKDYNKFVHSSIISRRLQQSANNRSRDSLSEKISSKKLINGSNTAVPRSLSMKSSGYRNIDSIALATSAASLQIESPTSDTEPHGMKVVYGSLDRGMNPAGFKVLKSSISTLEESTPTLRGASPTILIRGPSPSINIEGSSNAIRRDPPPLPRRKSQSSPGSISPPLTPISIVRSDLSDSPPSYYAPSPPSTPPMPPPQSSPLPPPLPARNKPPPLPLPSPSSHSDNSDSSSCETELNYIEIDMTCKPSSCSLPPRQQAVSRQTRQVKRIKQRREEEELRYAVIDHQATKALERTHQDFVTSRDQRSPRARLSPSLSRINSAPASSKRKPQFSLLRDRSGSVDSL